MMNKKPLICAAVAIGSMDVIGENGSMPWYSRQDFYHFKTITTPYPCIFGKNTYDNMPKKPLPNRLNIVCSSSYDNVLKDGVFYAKSIEDALKGGADAEKIFICGGSMIYKYALEHDLIDVLYLTRIYDTALEQRVKQNPSGFCYFPLNSACFDDKNIWAKKPFIYPDGILPEEKGTAIAKFYQCLRIR